ncbi:MAG: glycoside hydrolase family 97 protein [Planctomycetes bacterium]|nr:glycoside hydrolase family 97 protein [Planctomycetota bacterium]
MMAMGIAVVGVCILAGAGGSSQSVVVQSPDKQLSLSVSLDDDRRLIYHLDRGTDSVIESSMLGITVDSVQLGEGVSLGQPDRWSIDTSYPWRGVHSMARNRFNSAMIPITHAKSGTKYRLEVRVFNDGAGFRYIVPGQGKRQVSGEASAFRPPEGSFIWYQTNTKNYEGIHERHALGEVKPDTLMGPPVVVELPKDGGYLALTEAALFNYSGMTLRLVDDGSRELVAAFEDDKQWELEGTITSPWRVILVAKDLNELVNSDVIPNLNEAPAPSLAQADWIRPGRGLWHWWSGQMGNWDSVAYDRQTGWVDNAAKLGFEYYLVDAGWEENWTKPGKDKWALLKELTTYAAGKNVRIWVWKRWKTGRTEGIEMTGVDDPTVRREFFNHCKEAGVAGVKIDYMDSESKPIVDFYSDVLKDAAAVKLMIDFHGAYKPTGESRTYPHEMTREGIRGLEYNKWSALPPVHYASLPFTRFLAGHGDFTPCTFNPAMLKGTTVTLQLATAVCYTSPVMFYADKPEYYLQSPSVDVIKAIPSVWDETVVLPGSKIGDLAAIARLHGATWFVGIINGGDARSYNLDLSFLGQGEFASVQLSDDPQRPDRMIRKEVTVQGNTSLPVGMDAGGGFVGMFTPVSK